MSDLTPAADLVARQNASHPGESADYRAARNALLAEEIELRRHMERVAAQRRALPPSHVVTADYRFVGEAGETDFAGLFGEHDTLVVYNFMFGPERARPCPMCTAFLGPLAANAADIRQQVALAVVARAPIERLIAFKRERGWRDLPVYTDKDAAFGRAYKAWTEAGDYPAYNVFTKRDGEIRHFWGGEMGHATVDPGQDPRGSPEMPVLWNVLDTTPAGRDPDWYPKLAYA